jgi:hypothetical protein
MLTMPDSSWFFGRSSVGAEDETGDTADVSFFATGRGGADGLTEGRATAAIGAIARGGVVEGRAGATGRIDAGFGGGACDFAGALAGALAGGAFETVSAGTGGFEGVGCGAGAFERIPVDLTASGRGTGMLARGTGALGRTAAAAVSR